MPKYIYNDPHYEQPYNSKLDLSFELIRTDSSVRLGPNPFFLDSDDFAYWSKFGFDKS